MQADSQSDWRAGDIKARWNTVLRRLHDDRTYPHLTDDPFRFEVIDVGDDGADLIIHAYFRGDDQHCCPDPFCNFILSGLNGPGPAWARLRHAMAEECIDHLNPVRILQWRVTVEAGAKFHHGNLDCRCSATTRPFSYCVGPFVEPEDD